MRFMLGLCLLLSFFLSFLKLGSLNFVRLTERLYRATAAAAPTSLCRLYILDRPSHDKATLRKDC